MPKKATPVPVVDTRWFVDRLRDRQVSQRQLAKILKLDPAAVSLALRGQRQIKVAEAAQIAQVLAVDVGEVMRRAGATAPSRAAAAAVAAAATTTATADQVGVGAGGAMARSGSGSGATTSSWRLPVPLAGGDVAWLLLPRPLTADDVGRITAVVQAFARDVA